MIGDLIDDGVHNALRWCLFEHGDVGQSFGGPHHGVPGSKRLGSHSGRAVFAEVCVDIGRAD
jgi:hypothetical protein